MTPTERRRTDRSPLTLAGVGLMITMAAFVALVVAGTAAANLLPTASSAGDAAADRGVWMATQAWATPVAQVGLAVLFAGAIPFALSNIRTAIGQRRDAMAASLPGLIKGAHQ